MADTSQNQAEGQVSAVLRLTHSLGTRDGTLTKDAKTVNGFVEMTDMGGTVVKRPGAVVQSSPPVAPAQGMLLVNGIPVSISSDTLHEVNGAGVFPIPTITVPGQRYSVLSDTPVGTSLLKSPSGLWKFDGATVTKVTTGTYPATTLPGIAYLDGTYYVLGADGTVQGSDLQDPMTWPALNFIGGDAGLGAPLSLERHLNYITAIYSKGLQMFYDAANATGSPLSVVTNASWRMGASAVNCTLSFRDELFFIARSGEKGSIVMSMAGLQISEISSPAVNRVLARDPLTSVWMSGFRVAGHNLVLIGLPDSAVTLVYDPSTQHWGVWTSLVAGVEESFRGVGYLFGGGEDLVQERVTGAVWKLSTDSFDDPTGQIPFRVVTLPYTWGTLQRKFIPTVHLHTDTIPDTLSLRYSDDDYQTFSSFRPVDLSSDRKILRRCGSSRKRSWELLYTGLQPLRVSGLEAELDRGGE